MELEHIVQKVWWPTQDVFRGNYNLVANQATIEGWVKKAGLKDWRLKFHGLGMDDT